MRELQQQINLVVPDLKLNVFQEFRPQTASTTPIGLYLPCSRHGIVDPLSAAASDETALQDNFIVIGWYRFRDLVLVKLYFSLFRSNWKTTKTGLDIFPFDLCF